MVNLLIWPNSLLFFQTISVGVQTQCKINRLNAGMRYVVQVRCTLDPGEWSEWSSERHILIPSGKWMTVVLLAVFKIQVV